MSLKQSVEEIRLGNLQVVRRGGVRRERKKRGRCMKVRVETSRGIVTLTNRAPKVCQAGSAKKTTTTGMNTIGNLTVMDYFLPVCIFQIAVRLRSVIAGNCVREISVGMQRCTFISVMRHRDIQNQRARRKTGCLLCVARQRNP